MEKIELRGMSNQLCAPSFTPLCMCLLGEKSSSKARSSRSNLKNIEVELIRGSFKNYVDKEVGSCYRNAFYVQVQGNMSTQRWVCVQKRVKLRPRNY